jgi:hypothetical protein
MTDADRLARELGDVTTRLVEHMLRTARAGGARGDDESLRALRRDPRRVPGSIHFASMLAYGDFVVADGPSIRCEAIPGISGVATMREIETLDSGQPRVALRRILTHFHFDEPQVAIEQHYARESVGTLTGASEGSLLPGRASFSQYLILVLGDRPLANPEPLVMTADRVEEWPPIGSTFVSEGLTPFVDLADLDKEDAKPVAHLAVCKTGLVTDIDPVLPPDHQRSVVT